MAIGPDRVQVIKRESAALGGDPADDTDYLEPIHAQQDAIESAGLYLQDATNRDEAVFLERAGVDMRFVDQANPSGFSLTELSTGGSGVSVSSHRTLRQLIHFIDNGPANGFASGAYRENTGTVFPTAIVWYDDNTKVKKLVEKLITYTGAFATTIQWKMYDVDGSTVLATVTDAITLSGSFETSRTRTIA
jgi:hypothetical protein